MKAIEPGLYGMIKLISEKSTAYRESILLLTANRFDLFTHLYEKSLTTVEIAAHYNWDLRAAEIFLNALTAMNLLTKVHGRFSNTHIADRLLVKTLPDYQGDILNHHLNLWRRWSNVAEALETGAPLRPPGKKRSPEELRHFISGMSNTARVSAVKLWKFVDLTGRKKLLDVAGGPGTYAFYACQFFPGLKAVVFDLPEVEPIFKEHRADAEMQKLVDFKAGNLHTDNLPKGCDVALLSNIIHSFDYHQNQALIDKLDKALKPGALLLIKDFFISDDGTAPLFSALFAVNMLLGTERGGCYSRQQVFSWLEGTSFVSKGVVQLTDQAGVLLVEKVKGKRRYRP